MDVESRLRDDLESLSEGIRAPAGAARIALGAARRHQHRRRAAAAGLALVLVGGGSLAVAVHTTSQRAPRSVLGTTATAGAPSVQARSADLSAPTRPDVVDDVSFGGLPKGWAAALGLASRTVATASGRQTFHDIAWSTPDASHNIVLSVQRGATANLAQFAEASIAGGRTAALTPGSDAHQGIATSPGAVTAVGYKVLGPNVSVVLWGPQQYLSSVLDNTRELG
jgi:hypothetical protein